MTPKRKQAEFRRLVERIKSGEISTKDAASHAANLFEDEQANPNPYPYPNPNPIPNPVSNPNPNPNPNQTFRVAPNAADEKRRAFRRAQRAGAHASATPQPAAPAERTAPAATQSPKQSALAFNALVLAQVRVI